MKLPRRRLLQLAAFAAVLPAVSRSARAQAYPVRPIRLIVPFPPGGGFDTVGRPWAERIKALLGGAVVIENIGGGGGTVGAALAARARPDGYTLLLGGATTHVTETLLKNRPQYDAMKELEPIAPIAITAFAIAVHPSVPAKDLAELIAYGKANPGKLSYGTAGTGSLNQLTGELFKLRSGLDITHVPYRGAGPAIVDILAGQIPMIVPAMTNHVLELHRAGKIRVLAVTHGTRLAAAPELPTAVEQGLADLVSPNFIGVYAPAGLPRPLVEQIATANRTLLDDADYRALLVSGTFEPHSGLSPDAYRRYVEGEIARWAPIVKAIDLKID